MDGSRMSATSPSPSNATPMATTGFSAIRYREMTPPTRVMPTTATRRRPPTEAAALTPSEYGWGGPPSATPVSARSEVSVAIRPRNRRQALEERVFLGERSKLQSFIDDDRRCRHHAVARSEL